MSTGSRKKRPRHSTPEKTRMTKKIVQLRNAGKTWDEVEQDPEIYVSARQAQRWHSDISKKSSTDAFERWTISYSKHQGEQGDPPEKVSFLLQLLRDQIKFPAELDVVTLNWAWYLHEIDNSLDLQILAVLSTRYADADNFTSDKWLYPILDEAVAIKPWESLDAANSFFAAATGILWEMGYRRTKATDLMSISDIDLELLWAHHRAGGKRDSEDDLSPFHDPSYEGIPPSLINPDVAKLMHRRVTIGNATDIFGDVPFITLPEWGSRMRHSGLFFNPKRELDVLLNTNPFTENQEGE